MREAVLSPTGATRQLPSDIFGLNSPVPYSIPHEDPALIDIGTLLHPGHLRFPGGSVANFFEWRSGHLEVPEVEGASMYRNFMRRASQASRRFHPNGAHAESFSAVAAAMGAEMLWVVNLETSSAEEQAAWAADMKAKGVLPRRVELGNEFYLALLNDAASLARWPDVATTMAIMREYVDAMAPSLGPDNLIAVQAATSRWRHDTDTPNPGHHKHWVWDDGLEPADWFDAVTVHPYPEIDHVCGPGTAASLPGALDTVLPILLAKVDGGSQRLLDSVADQLPGKELWVTEWGIGEIAAALQGRKAEPTGFWLHVVARQGLAILRHPAVAVSSYHAFFFDGNVWAVARPKDGGGYQPMGMTPLLGWFGAAANHGATHERVDVGGSAVVPGGGPVASESYRDVEAALFTSSADGARTLLVHNACGDEVRVDLSGLAGGGDPAEVETIATPDLTVSYTTAPPPIISLPAKTTVDLPPWSVTRVVWR